MICNRASRNRRQLAEPRARRANIEALIITSAILGVPYYSYSIMGPQNPILIIKAPYITRTHEILLLRGS